MYDNWKPWIFVSKFTPQKATYSYILDILLDVSTLFAGGAVGQGFETNTRVCSLALSPIAFIDI